MRISSNVLASACNFLWARWLLFLQCFAFHGLCIKLDYGMGKFGEVMTTVYSENNVKINSLGELYSTRPVNSSIALDDYISDKIDSRFKIFPKDEGN